MIPDKKAQASEQRRSAPFSLRLHHNTFVKKQKLWILFANIKQLKAMNFDIRRFTDKTLYANANMLKDYSEDNPDPIPLLYQTGYLTIADYDPAARE